MRTIHHTEMAHLLRVCLLYTRSRRFLRITALTLFLVSAYLMYAPPAKAARESTTHTTKKILIHRNVIPVPTKEATGHFTIQESVKETDEKKTSPSIKDICIKIGAKLGSIGEDDCLLSHFQLSGGRSVENWPILLKDFPPLPYKKTNRGMRPVQARILLLGGIHGDEYSSISIVFKWIKILSKHHTGLFHWHIAPLVNPDGLFRKKATRVNARGVDLNRNFPTRDWKDDSTDYWVRRTGRDPRRFPGHAPLSEPESLWVFQEIQQFKPNVIVSVHAPFGLLDFDGPPSIPPERFGNIYLSLLGTYPGSLGRYAGENLKIPIITIELPNAGILPSEDQGKQIWVDLVQWLRSHAHSRKKHANRTTNMGAPRP